MLCAAAPSTFSAEGNDEVDLFAYELRFMFWGVSQEESVEDFLVRRARLIFKARPAEAVLLTFQFGHDNAGSEISREDEGLRIKDAYLNYKAADGFQVAVGQFKVPFMRHSLESGFNQLLVDRADLAGIRPAEEGARDLGVMLWGNRGGFQYRAAAFDGSDQEEGAEDSGFRGTVRVSYNWFEHESRLGYTGTTLGDKRILQIGAQIDRRPGRAHRSQGRCGVRGSSTRLPQLGCGGLLRRAVRRRLGADPRGGLRRAARRLRGSAL